MSLEPFTTALTARQSHKLRNTEAAQRALLGRILTATKGSAVARALGISGRESFEEFLRLPSQAYSAYVPFVEQTLDGNRYTFGTDPVVAFGETSGSLGVPKLIPHTATSLGSVREFAKRLLLFQLNDGAHYLPQFTKWLAVSASTQLRNVNGFPVGFISGLMYQIARKKRGASMLPTPEVAAISDWDERIERSVGEAWGQRVGTMLGVPAYLMRFLDAASQRANGKPLGDVWPLLGRVYYSGTSIEPYRQQMEKVLGKSLRMQAMYTATEGSFGAELDHRFPGQIQLMVDLTVFSFRDVGDPTTRLLAPWEVSPGRKYEIFVTARSGLLQYQIGDVVEIAGVSPLRVRIVGRTAEEINIATEKLSVNQVVTAIQQVAVHCEVHRDRFIVVPDPVSARRHLWIVESCGTSRPNGIAGLIDRAVAAHNPSYATLRQGDAMLEEPRVVVCESGCFNDYVAAGFATRGQFKFRHLFADASAVAATPGLERIARRIDGGDIDE